MKYYRKITNRGKWLLYIYLVSINLLYALIAIASKYTSTFEFLSLLYLIGLSVVIIMMGIYAFFWQQILKRTELVTAYMFKGTSLIFVLIFSAILFNEVITVNNIIGALIIISGIVLSAQS